MPVEVPDFAVAIAAAYGGIPLLDDEVPPVPPPVVEDDEPCTEVDTVSGAVCSRGKHQADLLHWFEDADFRIQWKELVQLHVH